MRVGIIVDQVQVEVEVNAEAPAQAVDRGTTHIAEGRKEIQIACHPR